MDETRDYAVKDSSLAGQGEKNIAWAEQEMAALLNVKKKFAKEKPFAGLTIGMALHVTKETAVLVRTLEAGGAHVAIASCNPLSTQDDVAAALAKSKTRVYAYKGETKQDYYRFLEAVVAAKPNITIDDGCDLVSIIHQKHPELIGSIIGGTEETTTGIIRLRAMEKGKALKYPVVAVNDNKTKHLLDNFYGTGQSAVDGIIRATNILIAGKTVVVVGYGDCGKGVAKRAAGLGANVIVTEVDAFRALQAKLDSYRVMPIAEAAEEGDIFVTVTGNKHVISAEHLQKIKSGAILANAGHFDVEIDLQHLEKSGRKEKVRPFLDAYMLPDGRKLYVCGEGRLVNLAAAEGHPSAVMSTSFCGQAMAAEYLVKHKGKLSAAVITLPEEVDDAIASLQLQAMDVRKDSLSTEQEKYLNSWEEGT